MSGVVDEASPTNVGEEPRGLGLSPDEGGLFTLDTAILRVMAYEHDTRDEAVVAWWNEI
jgi:hypothetical protein